MHGSHDAILGGARNEVERARGPFEQKGCAAFCGPAEIKPLSNFCPTHPCCHNSFSVYMHCQGRWAFGGRQRESGGCFGGMGVLRAARAAAAVVFAVALSATVVHAVLEEEPTWDQMKPEGLLVRAGAAPVGVGMAIDPGHLALRVKGGTAGLVDIYHKNPDVLALKESGLQGTGPRNASWVFLQRLEPPGEAASAFGEAMCIGGSYMATSFAHAKGNVGASSPVTGVALYNQDQPGSPWSLQAVLVGSPAAGVSVGGRGLMSMTELGDMLVVAKQERLAGKQQLPNPSTTPRPTPLQATHSQSCCGSLPAVVFATLFWRRSVINITSYIRNIISSIRLSCLMTELGPCVAAWHIGTHRTPPQ